MPRCTAVSVLVVALFAVIAPAQASEHEAALLLFRDQRGALHAARLPSPEALTTDCSTQRPPGIVEVEAVSLVVGGETQILHMHAGGEVIFQTAQGGLVPAGLWCRADETVVDALEEARRLPANRGPWLGLIAGFGGLSVAIGLVSLWGGGVGPRPRLEVEEEHHHDDAAHEEVASAGTEAAAAGEDPAERT